MSSSSQTSRRLIYLSHWRIPSEKTMSPLVLRTCEEFIKRGIDVELWVAYRRNRGLENTDPFQKHRISRRFKIRVIPALDLMRPLGKVGFILLLVSFNISSFFFLLTRPGSVIYAHDMRDVFLPSLLGRPLFVEIHDFYESSLRFINRVVLRRTAGLIVTNTIKMKSLNGRYGYPLERMLHQPNSVEYSMFDLTLSRTEARRQLGLPQDINIILYTGHLFGWKGVYTLAAATRYFKDDARVYFVGGTEGDRNDLKRFVREQGLERIEFLPHQEHSRIPIFLKAADVLALPNTAKEDASKYETSPVKLFEYLASGTPIIASDIPAIREVVSEKEVLFFTADDPKDLARATEEVLRNPESASLRTAAGQTLARSHSWERRAERISMLMRAYV